MTGRAIALLCVILFAWTPPVAHAQEEEPFNRGISARNQQRWRDVVREMTAAIQIRDRESDRKIRSGFGGFVGVGGTEYLPLFFLGEAHFALKECGPAVDAWTRSEQQGMVRRHRPDLFKIQQNGSIECERAGVLLLSRYESTLSSTQQVYNDAVAMTQRLVTRSQATPGAWRPEMKEQLERAIVEVNASYKGLTGAMKSRLEKDFADARAAAERARDIVTGLDAALTAALDAATTLQQQAADIESILSGADATDRIVESKKALWTPAHAGSVQAGRDALQRGRDRLGAAVRGGNASLLPDARAYATDASTRLRQVLDDLNRVERSNAERAFAELQLAAQEEFLLAENGVASLDTAISEHGAGADVQSQRASLESEINAAKRRYEASRKAENLSGMREAIRTVTVARSRLTELLAGIRPLTLVDRGVDPALVEGARLFFTGQYQAALVALEAADRFGPEVPLRVHGHLLRAAALHALYVRSGQADQSLRARALQELERCRSLNPEFVPSAERFSPAFITFFQNGQASAPGAAEGRP